MASYKSCSVTRGSGMEHEELSCESPKCYRGIHTSTNAVFGTGRDAWRVFVDMVSVLFQQSI